MGEAKQAEKKQKAKARAKGLGMEQRAAGAREEVGTPNPVIVAELPTITLRNAGAYRPTTYARSASSRGTWTTCVRARR